MEVATDLMQDLMSLGVGLHETPNLHRRALELASQLKQGAVYDAHYLALAESLGCELWTTRLDKIKNFQLEIQAGGIEDDRPPAAVVLRGHVPNQPSSRARILPLTSVGSMCNDITHSP